MELVDGDELKKDFKQEYNKDTLLIWEEACNVVDSKIAKQTAPLSRSEFLKECEGMGFKITKTDNGFRFDLGKLGKVEYHDKDCVGKPYNMVYLYASFDCLHCNPTTNLRQALQVIQALKGGE